MDNSPSGGGVLDAADADIVAFTWTTVWRDTQGLLLAVVSGGLYYLTFRLNEWFDPWAAYAQGITLLFLPAGVKQIALLLGGHWAFLGCSVALYALAQDIWAGASALQILAYSVISPASTWAGILLGQRLLGMRRDLANLRLQQLPWLDLLSTAMHGFLVNTYFIVAGMKTDRLLTNALAMMFGDYIGSFLFMLLLWLGLSRLKYWLPSGSRIG